MRYRFVMIILFLLSVLMLISCKNNDNTESNNVGLFKKEYTVGTDIGKSDITEFYYTYSNINYNAFYQRYHFYFQDGIYRFFHETRERKDEYGPTTEADRTMVGTVELSKEQWDRFFELISQGKVVKRSESADSGDDGPWFYLYWSDDKSKYQEYSFADYGAQKAFEEFCAGLAADPVPVSADKYPPIDETYAGNWSGSFANVSGSYDLTLEAQADGSFSAEFSSYWHYSDSSGGMNLDDVKVVGTVTLNDKGLTVLEGSLDDGSSIKDKTIKAVLSVNNGGIRMVVLECSDNKRVFTGTTFDMKR